MTNKPPFQPGVVALKSLDGEFIELAKPYSDEAIKAIVQHEHIQKAPGNLTIEQLEADIPEYIADWHADRYGPLGRPTFTCLEQRYGKAMFGGVDLTYTRAANVVLWQTLTQNLAQALINLLTRGEIHWHPTLALYYLTEGRALPLPLALLPIEEDYKDLHWLPVEFISGEACEDAFCPNRLQ
jgi:hypothetical protein